MLTQTIGVRGNIQANFLAILYDTNPRLLSVSSRTDVLLTRHDFTYLCGFVQVAVQIMTNNDLKSR